MNSFDLERLHYEKVAEDVKKDTALRIKSFACLEKIVQSFEEKRSEIAKRHKLDEM